MNFKIWFPDMLVRHTGRTKLIWMVMKVFEPLQVKMDGAGVCEVQGARMCPFSKLEDLLVKEATIHGDKAPDPQFLYDLIEITFTRKERTKIPSLILCKELEK